MDFLLNTLLSGILYDCMKEGMAVTYQKIFGNFIGCKMDHNNPIYVQFLDELREINKNNYGLAKEEAVNNLVNVHFLPPDIFEELIMRKCYPGIVCNY